MAQERFDHFVFLMYYLHGTEARRGGFRWDNWGECRPEGELHPQVAQKEPTTPCWGSQTRGTKSTT